MSQTYDVHGGNVYENEVCYDFSTSINPFPLPEEVNKVQKAALSGMNCYPDPNCAGLLRALCAKLTALGTEISEEDILFGNGATELLYALMRLVPRDKKLLIFAPGFSEYERAADSCGIVTEKIILCEKENNPTENCFLPDIKKQELFLEKISSEIGLIILCNPNNPSGKLYPRPFLETVCKRGMEQGVLVCIDECYGELIDASTYDASTYDASTYDASTYDAGVYAASTNGISMRNCLQQYPNLMILRSFTKTYGLPGYRLGYLFSKNREICNKVRQFLPPWNVAQPAQEVAIACMEQVNLDRIRKELTAEKEFLKNELSKLSIIEKVYDSDTCFLMFRGKKGLYERLLEEKIMIRDLSKMDGLSEGYYRIGVKTHEDNLVLIRAIQKLNGEV